MDTSNGKYDTCVRRFYDVGSGNVTKVFETTYTIKPFSFCHPNQSKIALAR